MQLGRLTNLLGGRRRAQRPLPDVFEERTLDVEFTTNPDRATPFLNEETALHLGEKIGAKEITTHHYGDQTRWLIVMPDASFVRLESQTLMEEKSTPRKSFKPKGPFLKYEADEYLRDAG